MTPCDLLTELLDVPKVRVIHYERRGPDRLTVFIESTQDAALCPTCHQISLSIHDTGEPQMIRDLPIWNRQSWLHYTPRRFECDNCDNTFVERVAWREPGFAYTVRYEEFVYEQVRRESVAQVARDERLTEDIVQDLFARWTKKRLLGAAIRA